MDPELVRCRADQFGVVKSILREAAEWLMSRGNDQWKAPHDENTIRESIERGDAHLVYIAGELAGTITLQWADPRIWGELPASAGYVHRLAVRRAFAGRGLGRMLLMWAEQRSREEGRSLLRLDCVARNAALCDYYAAAGFTTRGSIRLGGEQTVRLWEKRID